MTGKYLPNDAAESHTAQNNSVLECVWPPKLINVAHRMETLANLLSVFKRKFLNKYILMTPKNKLDI